MTKKKIKPIILLFGFCLCVALCWIGLSLTKKNASSEKQTQNLADVTFEAQYDIDTELSIASVVENFEGEDVEAEIVVRFPDGNAYKTQNPVLSQSGTYTVEFMFLKDGELLKSDSRSFTVYENAFSFENEESSAVYDSTLKNPGMKVSLMSGDTITFNHVIDLNGLTKEDSLITAYTLPDTEGSLEFTEFYVTLTDVSDESKSITMMVWYTEWYKMFGYARAGFNNRYVGLEMNAQQGEIIHSGSWGAPFSFSFHGLSQSSGMINFSLDADTCEVYAGSTFVCDLNAPKFFKSGLWEGFTDNKVKLSVTTKGCLGSKSNFVLTNVLGADFNAKYVKEAQLPTIKIVDDKAPLNGVVGGTYDIPEAIAYLGQQEKDVYTSVYYNYYDQENRVNVNYADGKFKTEKVGVYTIEYKAYNQFGEYATKLVHVGVKNELPLPTLTVFENTAQKTGYRGGLIFTADYAVESSDKLAVRSDVTVQKDGQNVAFENGMFLAESVGTYTVTYTVTDHTGRTVKQSYDVSVSESTNPVFNVYPELPAYYLGGYDYSFPALKAFNYATNETVDTKIRYRIDDGEPQNVDAGKPVVINCTGENGVLKLEYYVTSGETVVSTMTIVKPIVRIYDGYVMDMSKFFECQNGTSVEKNAENYNLNFTTDGSVKFIKEQVAENFILQMCFDDTENQWANAAVYFTDSKNPQERVAIRFQNQGNKFLMSVGEAGKYDYSYQTISFSYSEEKKAIILDDTYYYFRKTVDGEPFNGFSSGLIYVEFEMADVSGESKIELYRFNSQFLNDSITFDTIQPRIIILGDVGGKATVGSEVSISRAMACDIFDPDLNFFVSVYDPSGDPITSKDGVLLLKADPTRDYVITLTELGEYSVEYSAQGTWDNKPQTIRVRLFAIKETEEATITVYGDIVQEAKLGDVVILPTAKAKDVDGKDLKVLKMVLTPSQNRIELDEDYKSFVANQVGVYTVMYYAVNSDGESLCVRFTVEVKDEN